MNLIFLPDIEVMRVFNLPVWYIISQNNEGQIFKYEVIDFSNLPFPSANFKGINWSEDGKLALPKSITIHMNTVYLKTCVLRHVIVLRLIPANTILIKK